MSHQTPSPSRLVRRLALALGVGLLWSALTLSAAAATRVMILPFEAPKISPEIESLGPGTMDSMINALRRLPDFIVLDRATISQAIREQAFQRSGLVDDKSAIQLGKLLGAQVMVTGRVQVAADRIRLTATFVEVETGIVRQAETVTGPLADVFDLQDALARQFVANQGVLVTAAQAETMTRVFHETQDLAAYTSYQHGRAAYLRFTQEGYQEAIEWYKKALAADDSYALAYSGLAESLTLWAHLRQQNAQPYQALLDEAHEVALKALTLKDDLPEAHRAMALVMQRRRTGPAREHALRATTLAPTDAEAWWVLWLTGDRDPDSPDLKKALDLNPRLLTAIVDRGVLLGTRGRWDDAIYEFRTAIRITPDDAAVHNELGIALKLKGRGDEAIESYQTALRLNPQFFQAHFNRGLSLKTAGRLDEAIIAYREAIRINPSFAAAYTNLGNALKEKGQADEAIQAYRMAIWLEPEEPSTHFNLGMAFKQVGRNNEAMRAFIHYTHLAPPKTEAVAEALRMIADLLAAGATP